jgi:hypothetical protein
MSERPFYAPDQRPTPRQPRLGEPLWAIRKDGQQLDCELRDGTWGVEVQIYCEREFLYGRRWATRAQALEEADARKAHYLGGRRPHRVNCDPLATVLSRY